VLNTSFLSCLPTSFLCLQWHFVIYESTKMQINHCAQRNASCSWNYYQTIDLGFIHPAFAHANLLAVAVGDEVATAAIMLPPLASGVSQFCTMKFDFVHTTNTWEFIDWFVHFKHLKIIFKFVETNPNPSINDIFDFMTVHSLTGVAVAVSDIGEVATCLATTKVTYYFYFDGDTGLLHGKQPVAYPAGTECKPALLRPVKCNLLHSLLQTQSVTLPNVRQFRFVCPDRSIQTFLSLECYLHT